MREHLRGDSYRRRKPIRRGFRGVVGDMIRDYLRDSAKSVSVGKNREFVIPNTRLTDGEFPTKDIDPQDFLPGNLGVWMD